MHELLKPTEFEFVSTDDKTFPSPLRDWVSQCLSHPVLKETRSDCRNCPMAKKTEFKDEIVFKNETRCCNYIPKLSNFQVGNILLDERPAMAKGRALIAKRIANRRGATPLGLYPDTNEKAAYWALTEYDKVGQSDELACPYWVKGEYPCSIWQYRPSTCATWFCRHQRGQTSKNFWLKLEQLLRTLEHALSYHCLSKMELSPTSLDLLFPHHDDEPATDMENDQNYRAVWSEWMGKEFAFFKACAKVTHTLSWKEITRIAGADFHIKLESVVEAERFMNGFIDSIPDILVPGEFCATGSSVGTRVISYSKLDPLNIPISLMMALDLFDGRGQQEVLRDIQKKGKLKIDQRTLMALYDFGILKPLE